MATTRLRLQTDLEKSLAPSAVVVTDINNEQAYLPVGTNGQILSVVGGVAQWAAPVGNTVITVTDGTNSETISNGSTLLFDAGQGASVLVGATDTVTYAVRLSADADNAAVFGSDGGVFVEELDVVDNAVYDDATNTILITFTNLQTISVPIVDDIGQFLSNYTISDGTNTHLVNNHDTVTYTGTNKITTTVTGATVDIRINTSGATAGQLLTSTGSGAAPIWANPVVPTPPPVPKKDEFSPTSGALNVTLSQAPSSVTGYTNVDIYRNGKLLQSSEYTIVGLVVNFTTAMGTSPGAVYSETITAKYYV